MDLTLSAEAPHIAADAFRVLSFALSHPNMEVAVSLYVLCDMVLTR